MNIAALREKLVHPGKLNDIVYLEETESTNKFAGKNLHSLLDDTIVISSHQTKGKGRFDRNWESSKNENITISLIKKFELDIDRIHLVNFYTSLILFFSLKELLGEEDKHELKLKWPNDLLLNKKKISGILLEVKNLTEKEKLFIIGIGLNVNQVVFPDDLNGKATSLKSESGNDFDREIIVAEFIEKFYENLCLIENGEKLLKIWKENSYSSEKNILFRQYSDDVEKTGQILDIENDGAIMVKFEDGAIRKFYSGEIKILN